MHIKIDKDTNFSVQIECMIMGQYWHKSGYAHLQLDLCITVRANKYSLCTYKNGDKNC